MNKKDHSYTLGKTHLNRSHSYIAVVLIFVWVITFLEMCATLNPVFGIIVNVIGSPKTWYDQLLIRFGTVISPDRALSVVIVAGFVASVFFFKKSSKPSSPKHV